QGLRPLGEPEPAGAQPDVRAAGQPGSGDPPRRAALRGLGRVLGSALARVLPSPAALRRPLQRARRRDRVRARAHALGQDRAAAGCVRPFHLGGRPVPDLDHPIDVFRRQLNGGRMNGFVAAYRQVGAGTHQSVMGYYDERDLPFSWAVARRYVLFDRFFTSASAGTLANHMFWMTGRRGTNDQDQIPPNGFGNLPTIFDRLQAAGVSWRVYVENYDPGVTYRNRSGPRSSQPSTVPLLAFDRFIDDKRLFGNIVGLDQYYDDLRNGTLPAVSYIVTSASSERPPGSVTAGQQLV